jgi:hypothetical protein
MGFTIAFSLVLGLAQGDPLRYSHRHLPIHGTVCAGKLYGFFGKQNDGFSLFSIDYKNPAKNNTTKYCYPGGGIIPSYRHHIRDGTVWLSPGPLSGIKRLPLDDLKLLDFASENGLHTYYEKYDGWADRNGEPDEIQLQALAEKDRKNYRGAFFGPAQGIAGFGTVPISPNSCKTFLLFKDGKKLEAWDTLARFDAKKRRWLTIADERNLETFKSDFLEDFYVFIRKSDYYFVTESGKLYHAPPPKKGEKSRKMTALWDDPDRPINAIIEDADRDKVWLFAKHKKDVKRGYYFEMKSATTFETFDPTKLKRVNIEGRAKTLLELWPLVAPQAKKKANRR